MSAFFRSVLVLATVFSVGGFQVFGIMKGYFCDCTGATSVVVDCEAVVCHPAVVHGDGCGGDEHEGHGERDSAPPAHDGHKHSEVRETLEVTGLTSGVQVPAVACFVLSPAFHLPEMSTLISGNEIPALPPDGSPPTPLLVARTMVMRV